MTNTLHAHLRAQNYTFSDIKIFSRLCPDQAAQALTVTEKTLNRWCRDDAAPPWAWQLLGMYGGWFGWPGWHQFQVWPFDGRLYRDGFKHGLTPELLARCWYISYNLDHFERITSQ